MNQDVFQWRYHSCDYSDSLEISVDHPEFDRPRTDDRRDKVHDSYSFTAIASNDLILMMATKHKVPPILWTILCIVVLAFEATPYAQRFNGVFLTLRLLFVSMLSILAVREWWKYQHRSQWTNMEEDTAHNLLRRLRRWATDEQQIPRQSASHIVEGGCHHGPRLAPPNFNVGWTIVTLIIVIIVIAVVVRHST